MHLTDLDMDQLRPSLTEKQIALIKQARQNHAIET